jgi:hypothetical protein
MKKNLIKLSLAIAVVSTSSTFAGQIISDMDQGFTANKQYAFGGWNLDNVNVKIVDLNDPHYNIGDFNNLDGTYSVMNYGLSFESDISSNGTVLARLVGKEWPLGEPAGIKTINGDTGVKNGKPENCLMATTYLATGYLDSAAPQSNICSGPFKSHKRFKIEMMKTTYTADGAFGKPIDMVFNLVEGDSSSQRYQVIQKINNHTGKRLDGYKLEVLDDAKMPNIALTLSLGYGENAGSNIWGTDEMANMPHGLWGPIDSHFGAEGFFDSKRSYYPVGLSNGNTVISYIGPMQGGNYQQLFGNWMPSKWHPMGIFYNNGNPGTEDELLAFWGDPLGTGTNGWHKGQVADWAALTEEEEALWTGGGQYYIAGLEDSVNLGLNYIVNVGENAAIGGTFTIRITPHFAPSAEQGTPSYVTDAPDPTHPGSERDNPDDGKGSVPAYDNMSLLVMIFGFLGIGALIARRKLV